jgi:hypothetical protein
MRRDLAARMRLGQAVDPVTGTMTTYRPDA